MVDTSKHVAVFKVIRYVCVWSALCSLYCLIELQYMEESVTKNHHIHPSSISTFCNNGALCCLKSLSAFNLQPAGFSCSQKRRKYLVSLERIP